MVSWWCNQLSTIPIPELIRILSNIATYIHENSASGLMHEEKMKEICIQSIKDSLSNHFDSKANMQEIENQTSEFVRTICEDVGILASRGRSLYGFLHLTFQKIYLFTTYQHRNYGTKQRKGDESSLQNITQSLRYHMNDPRFCVPIALALGKISYSWSQHDFDRFCYEFIKEQDKFNSLHLFGAYTLINCVNDLVNYRSDKILFDTLDRLIISVGQHQ
ncbi:unnamed protein product [Rotaria sp. Silwood1]|nr:unnamed protein product [Rotaria sp. Silwood1]